MDAKTITNAIKTVSNIVMSDSGQKFLCGTYSNGEPRSVVDAMRDEYVSPDDRANWDKKKKKKKNKERQTIKDLSLFFFILSLMLCIFFHSDIWYVHLFHIIYQE